MVQDLSYIRLKDLKPELLLGTWHVRTRIMSDQADAAFLNNDILIIEQSAFTSSGIENIFGHWIISISEEVAFNPQIHFHHDTGVKTMAIITRLVINRDSDECKKQLSLFFSSGVEIIYIQL